MVGAPRLSDIQPVILGGFSEQVPPKVKLWEIQTTTRARSMPTRKITANQDLLYLAH